MKRLICERPRKFGAGWSLQMKLKAIDLRSCGLGVVILLASSTSFTQHTSFNTFLVYYKQYVYHDGDGADGYGLFVNGPMTADARRILEQKRPSTIFLSYLNVISVEVGVTRWADDVIKNHPGALLKTIAGTRDSTLPQRKKFAWGYLTPYDSTKSTKNYFLTNPASAEWREYYVGLARKQLLADPQVGRRGIFLDNVWPFFTMFFARAPKDLQVDMNGDGIMDKKDDWAWAEGMAGFSRYVKHALGDSTLLFANFGTRWDDKGTGFLILTQGRFDGVMNESFAHNSLQSDSSSYPRLETWLLDVNALMIADSLDKITLAQSLGSEDDKQARLFCLGSFLLGCGPRSYYNYRFHSGYDTLYRLPEFDLDIGTAASVVRNAAQEMTIWAGVYKRTFSKGSVYVNMGRSAQAISVERNEQVLQLIGGTVSSGGHMVWSSASSIVLKPRCAAIIRRVNA